MIRHLPTAERPRERLVRDGAVALSDVDLIAVILRTGCRDVSALTLAQAIRGRYRSLADLARATPVELARIPGLGPARAAALAAGLALGVRAALPELARGRPMRGSADAWAHFRGRLERLVQERFYVALLDGRGRLLRDVRVSEGSLTASIVHPREVFRIAIREAAASVILVHNHPSGDPTPSQEDRALTARLVSVGELLGIRVLDHIVVGEGAYVSFADQGWIVG